MLHIFSIFLARTSGGEELKSASRRQNTSVHALFTVSLMFLESHLCCAPPPGPNSGGILNWPGFLAERKWWMAVAVRAMNIGLIQRSMIYLSFPFVECQRSMSGEYDPKFQSLQVETCTSKLVVKTTSKQERNFEHSSRTFLEH